MNQKAEEEKTKPPTAHNRNQRPLLLHCFLSSAASTGTMSERKTTKTQVLPAGNGSIAFLRDGNHVLVGGETGDLFNVDVNTGNKTQHHIGEDPIVALAASPDGAYFATNVTERNVALFDMTTMEQSKLLLRGQSSVRHIAFSADSSKMYACLCATHSFILYF